MYRPACLCIVLLLLPGIAPAGRILHADAAVENGIYSASVTARIAATPKQVFQLITDYNRLTEINPAILESRVLQLLGPSRTRVHTRMEVCILVFCKTILQVQDVEQLSEARIVAEIVPGQSDFRSGHAEWVLEEAAGHTTLTFTAAVEPDFWVPPLIGPWLFRQKIISELLITAAYLESNSNGVTVP